MTYTIYLRTNTANNKQYVGQTCNFKKRNNAWNCLKYYYANEHICNDREKYGLDAWTVEALAETDNREEAWELEQRFIKDYNTLWPNGYNISDGGAGATGVAPWHKGKHLSDEHKQKMSEAHKGKHHTEESKKKMSEAKKGIIPKCATPKQVYQYTLDGKLVAIWPSATEAAEKLGINQGHISECCNGKRKSAGGFRWSF